MSTVTTEQAREAMIQLYRGWVKAVGGPDKDYKFFDRHLADGWRYVDYFGVRRDKDEYLALVDTMTFYSQEMRQMEVRFIRDDLIIASGVYYALGEVKSGQKHDNTIIFSAVWELHDDVWRCLLHHTTRVPPAP
ncbi:nuclear transport factor 2 family protein [Chondromyces apiculatus]|uniref:DUF4440 domain-containing protein n=1 Tax=Chondromyces apiculatus DSM 436 TaxID=1192034 RepID=A0A017T1F5_9BACT|nr:nuclear transport factor 2 family protein [Chondromyces apiculatus]EYF03064.1 Hypothetical protein CAP_6178 [Chondromyces apiculatus DSM 436]